MSKCDLCVGECRGHSLGHPEEWVPEVGSRAAAEDIMSKDIDIPVSVQNITPTCRANRTSFGALEEAISRVRQAYVAYHDAPDNEGITWVLSLVRRDA